MDRVPMVIMLAMVFASAAPGSAGSESREEARTYVTSGGMFNSCNVLPEAAPFDDFNGGCFEVLPGETSLTIRIDDLVNERIFATLGFQPAGESNQATFFCTEVTVDIPPDATSVIIYLWSGAWGAVLKVLGENPCETLADDFATAGTLVANFQ